MDDQLFRNTLATNGLAQGYALRHHKRKRKVIGWFILLITFGGIVAYADQIDQALLDTVLLSQSILGLT